MRMSNGFDVIQPKCVCDVSQSGTGFTPQFDVDSPYVAEHLTSFNAKWTSG